MAGCFLLLFAWLPLAAQDGASDLYAQATQAMLERSFPAPQVEYVLLDARTKQTIAQRWEHPDAAVPAGSLLKPFVAMAYSRMAGHGRPFPTVLCRGRRDGCWRAAGHGSMTLERALAESCNAYFLALARELIAGDAMDRVSADFGLPTPPARRTAAMLIGVTPEWRVAPVALARAYVTLAGSGSGFSTQDRRVMARLRAGMREAALPGGTAAKLGWHPGGALAKTGTAPCVAAAGQRCRASGDGLVVVLAPAENPHWVLLVRQRGTTGAQTAEVAGKMLASLEDGHALNR
jgi:cell division protein FtsI/penicillin-binding protein 2